ncbi:hypothetical protein JOJ88_003039 [Pantoea cypripedii]|nr:hypothetical protein [Pantoea cypripedii]
MYLTTSTAEYNLYSATQNVSIVLVIQRTSDNLCIVTPDYGYSNERIIDNYVRNIDALIFADLPSDVTETTWLASFNATTA